jgi:hypothetical protein
MTKILDRLFDVVMIALGLMLRGFCLTAGGAFALRWMGVL